MRYARWRIRSLLILVLVIAVVGAGAAKGKRYVELRKRIAVASREERILLDEYQRMARLRLGNYCGNWRRQVAACLALAAERRREIEHCEGELRRIW